MLGYSDQPTPPFNSPYQQHTSRSSLLDSPYPSPNRVEPGSKYAVGLGLYSYQQHCLPPSPAPTWVTHPCSGAPALVTEAIADPWNSGAFEHPVSQSPPPWSSAQTSPRSSLSSTTREMSVFSQTSADTTYTEGWMASACYDAKQPTQINIMQFPSQHRLSVVPDRMNVSAFSYDNTYGTSSMATLESIPTIDYRSHEHERTPSERTTKSLCTKDRSKYTTTSVPRQRMRNPRHTDPANAQFRCYICPDKGFARRYNFSQHMLTHEAHRKKDHACTHAGCTRAFTRKTDLIRHNVSTHLKRKDWKCPKCPRDFSRKDTLRRHEEDGCSRRYQVHVRDDRFFAQT